HGIIPGEGPSPTADNRCDEPLRRRNPRKPSRLSSASSPRPPPCRQRRTPARSPPSPKFCRPLLLVQLGVRVKREPFGALDELRNFSLRCFCDRELFLIKPRESRRNHLG